GGPARAPLLPPDRPWAAPPRGRAPLVHAHVRPRQHPHQPPVAAVHARTGRDDPAGTRGLAGKPRRRLPGRGPGPHPPRDAVRRDDGVRGATSLPVLRLRGRHPPVRRPVGRVRTLDRRPVRGPTPRARGEGGPRLDRRPRRPPRRWLRLVSPAP